jgi:hypothetical protein
MAKCYCRAAGAALLSIVIGACASTDSAHENFKNIMNAKVGTRSDSPSARLWRDPAARISVRTLNNGNVEEGYRQWRACKYYFEIEPTTQKIVGWRYEGARDECVVWP